MRALGPQSVSSFLKIALDVVYVAAVGVSSVVGPMVIALLVATPFMHSPLQFKLSGQVWASPFSNGTLVALMVGVEIYVVFLVLVLNRIRRIVDTLIMGDPFRPENVSRLRWIGAEASDLAYEQGVEDTLDALAAHLERHIDCDRILSLAR